MPKSIKTLIRLAKREVEKEQEIVGNLQTRRDALQEKWDQISAQTEKERELTEVNPELSASFGSYIKNAMTLMEKISKDVNKLDERLEIQREKLREAFAEQKKYEIALENKEEEIDKKAKKKEQTGLDEIASQGYRRKD